MRRVIGSFDSESKFTDAATGAETSVLTTAGRGYFVIGLLCVGQEPTDHALKDIAAKAAELEACRVYRLVQSQLLVVQGAESCKIR